MVMAQSLFKALRERHPDSPIDVLAPGWSLPLLARMPEVRRGIDMPLGHGRLGLADRWRLGRELRGRYRQAIVLPNSWKSALLPWAADIPMRTGWRGEMRYGLLNDMRCLDKQRYPMTVQRFVALAADADAPLPEIQPPRLDVRAGDVQAALQALQVKKNASRRVLALCPGAEYGPAKQWPTVHYAELGRQFAREGWDLWLFGSDKDRAITEGIAATCKVVTNLAGRTTLEQAVDLMSLADAVVSNDSGLMHVAAALDRPLVALYGSSDPGFTPPLNQRHRIVSLGLSCSPCFKRECPLGTTACLVDMTVAQVAAALREVIA
ncbi:MAG: lipopolysaccharide heptosyltransferase II [Gammaproteobacteria bacterium]|nr:lipopolysaccharide heptosyltransferase II [Gammaproteobacteria bacterium]